MLRNESCRLGCWNGVCYEGVEEGRASSDLWSMNAERWPCIAQSVVVIVIQLEGVHWGFGATEPSDTV
jgi:hypothetical protein